MMKITLCITFLVVLTAFAPSFAADSGSINGTWSGNWTPKGGIPDAITVELKQDEAGRLTGKFLNPAAMDFAKATLNPKTGLLTVEAMDQKSGKHYKLEGKVEGTEIKGTLTQGDITGDLRLIKWTFFGR
jgi:hypothetical protein